MSHPPFEHGLQQNTTKVAVISSASCFTEGFLYNYQLQRFAPITMLLFQGQRLISLHTRHHHKRPH